MAIINFEHTDIVNNGNLIISDLSMSVEQGEFVYIIGKVGSGKTSIIRAMIGDIEVRNGSAEVLEFNLHKLKQKQIPYLRRRIGVVFQDFQLLMDRTVEENLKFVLKATGWKSNGYKNRVRMTFRIAQVLDAVGMGGKSGKMPHELSGGEQQRIAIARALLNSPEIIIADEPTGNLDTDTAEEIMQLLMRLNKENGHTVIMVTHNNNLFAKYPFRTFLCDRMNCIEMKQEDTTPTIDLSEFV